MILAWHVALVSAPNTATVPKKGNSEDRHGPCLSKVTALREKTGN